MATYTPEQRQMLNLAMQLSRGDSPRTRRSLLEALLVESGARNLTYGDRDSEGVLQQRPSTGWGPASEDAKTDMQQYLARARAAERQGFRGDAGDLAQRVQGSAFPDRYGQRLGEVNALLGGAMPEGGAVAAAAPPSGTGGGRHDFAQAMIESVRAKDPQRGTQALLKLVQGGGAAPPAAAGAPMQGDTPGEYDELIYHAPGHEDHLHYADSDVADMMRFINYANQMGANVRENPYTDPVDPVHVKGSHHYQTIGTVNGRKVGGAADVSGPPGVLERIYRHYGGKTHY